MKAIIIAAALVSVSAAASANGVTMSGDWGYGVNAKGIHSALTVNASGSSLNQSCNSQGNCWYGVALKTTCNDGGKYSGLISSPLGAAHVNLVCSKNEFLIEEFDAIDDVVRNASTLGIVTALESGEFAVSRFSLSGSTRAVDGMRAAAGKAIDQQPATSQSRTADIRI